MPNRKNRVTRTKRQKCAGRLWTIEMDGMGKNTNKVMQMAWDSDIAKKTTKARKDGKKVNPQREPGTTGDFQTALNRFCQALKRADSVGVTYTKNEMKSIVKAIDAMGDMIDLFKSSKSGIRTNQSLDHVNAALRNAAAWKKDFNKRLKPKQPSAPKQP